MNSPEPWIMMDEVSAYLKKTPETVRSWIKNKGLPATKPGKSWLFKLSEIDEWLIQNNQGKKVSDELSPTKYRICSLFSGCGGLDLGFCGGFEFQGNSLMRLNTEVVYANDFDSDAVKSYNQNIPTYDESAVCHECDIRDVEEGELPDFEILLAGFPCQPFSNAGLRGGVNDKYERGTLFEECERIIKHKVDAGKKPKAFVFENVRGILSSKMDDGTPVVDEIIGRMNKLGYNTVSKLLKASDYGVPQNRYRVFIIGVDENLGQFNFDEMDRVVDEFNLPSVSHERPEKILLGSILNGIEQNESLDHDYWKYTDATQLMIDQIGPCDLGEEGFSYFNEGFKYSELPPEVKKGRSWKNIPVDLLTPRFRRIYDDPKKYHSPNFFRRFALGEINGTITASAQPENCGITHPIKNRRYSVAEIARIQSFPDSYTFKNIQLQSRYKVIGNAVPPVLAWVVAKSLFDCLERSMDE